MVTTWKKNDLDSLIPFVCFFFMTVKLVLPCFNSESWNEPYSPGNIFKLLLQRNHDKINWLINSSVAITLRRIDSKFKIQMINSMHGTYKYGIVRIFFYFSSMTTLSNALCIGIDLNDSCDDWRPFLSFYEIQR